MGDLLKELSAEFFGSTPRTSFLEFLATKVDDDSIFRLLEIDNDGVRRFLLHRVNKRARAPEFQARLAGALGASTPLRLGTLIAIGCLHAPLTPVLQSGVLACLDDDDARVRLAAARVVAFRMPENASRILPLLQSADSFEATRLICLSQNTEVLWPLLRAWGFPEKSAPLPAGWLLNPRWLAEEHACYPAEVERLARDFGYQEETVTPAVLSLWREGYWFVSREMAAANPARAWEARVRAFAWQLLPFSLGRVSTESLEVNVNDPLDVALFLADVREADISNLETARERDPARYRTQENQRVLVCAHAPAAFVRRRFVDDAKRLASRIRVAPQNLGGFLVDHARTLLETEDEDFVESDLILRAKWLALGKGYDLDGISLQPASVPVKEDRDFPLLKFAVLKPFMQAKADQRMSVGAQAALAMADYLGWPSFKEELLELERLYEPFAAPVGCELQLARVPYDVALAWKQAFRALGVPSPRRPEYKDMVELAFRPCFSYHALALGPLLMHQLGLVQSGQNIAMHVSVQGDLGDFSRYLAFLHQAIHQGERKPAPARWRQLSNMARLMSKGAVCLNEDAEPARAGLPAACRTELRVYACHADEADGEVLLNLSYIDDLVSTQLLSSAAYASHPVFASIVEDFKAAVEMCVADLPASLGALLRANYYEATGEPRDGEMVELLPFVQLRSVARRAAREQGMEAEIEYRFTSILGTHARRVHDAFGAHFAAGFDFGRYLSGAFGVPYFLPECLREAVAGGHARRLPKQI